VKNCPVCGEEISRLVQFVAVEVNLEMMVDGECLFVRDRIDVVWRCPVCDKVLVWDFDDIAQFLGCRMSLII
jgi:predicted RNA-binding Zn-ribbon protein involved in translation (DUF1610 family)